MLRGYISICKPILFQKAVAVCMVLDQNGLPPTHSFWGNHALWNAPQSSEGL